MGNSLEGNCVTENCVIYCRVSCSREMSLRDQESVSFRYAMKKGYEVIKVFKETKSGKDITKLTEFGDTLTFIRNNSIKHLIVYEISRLGRNTDLYDIIVKLMEHCTIHSVFDELVCNNDSNIIVHQKLFSLVLNSYTFSLNLSKRMKMMVNEKRKRGEYLGRITPYGFKIAVIEKRKYLIKDKKEPLRHINKKNTGICKKRLTLTRKNLKLYKKMSKNGEAKEKEANETLGIEKMSIID
uniref:Resolvase/invertase-type recombinase catalytic domain-containing protein n=1 Tax=viral metagenome TaxID=1070528 RepID=A0A6C0JSL2_9ZZZZ